ncbi:uncharacterized protein MONOS_18655 [Monocercomonoides exilis]|uniref:uncharacterized protein n=1 Tax=Monocercomonoides exilis TaxID=2049356 RepID=UPI00355999B2|nr:hypothetical protein MONOS_18655 [Monocercomonoides exilis]
MIKINVKRTFEDFEPINEHQITPCVKRFSDLFPELICCPADEQKQKLDEINSLLDEMDDMDLRHILSKELFKKINEMIEKKKLSLENALLLAKHVGFCKLQNIMWIDCFERTSLGERIEKMIVEEDLKKKEEKNEKLLADLCECYLLLNNGFSSELVSICVPCLLKVALNKDESEETQKEVEMALLALSNISKFYKIKKEMYLNDIREIIKYHHEHHNLTQLAYQSAWMFLMDRFHEDEELEGVIVNELHFVGEATKELQELMESGHWKKKEKCRKFSKEVFITKKWLTTISRYFNWRWINTDNCEELVSCLAKLCRVTRKSYLGIFRNCIDIFEQMIDKRFSDVTDFLGGEAVNLLLEDFCRLALPNKLMQRRLILFGAISKNLKGKKRTQAQETKRKKTAKELFEKYEEEGFEDIIFGFIRSFSNDLFKSVHKKLDDFFVYF